MGLLLRLPAVVNFQGWSSVFIYNQIQTFPSNTSSTDVLACFPMNFHRKQRGSFTNHFLKCKLYNVLFEENVKDSKLCSTNKRLKLKLYLAIM